MPVVANELLPSGFDPKLIDGFLEYDFGLFRATESGVKRGERGAKCEVVGRLCDGAFHQLDCSLWFPDRAEEVRNVDNREAVPWVSRRAVVVELLGSFRISEVVLCE
jgi:hypothetical protein